MGWVLIVVSVIVFAYILKKLVGPRNKKRLPPEPKGLPILGHFHLLGKNPHHDLYDLSRKYGAIMGLRLGMVPAVVVSSPAAAELVLKTHDLIFASRPTIATTWHITYERRDLVFGSYGPYWRDMRKLCVLKLLSNYKVSQFEPTRKAEVGLLVTSLKGVAERNESVNLSGRVLDVNADMNCLMILGKKFSDMDVSGKGFLDVIMEVMEISAKFNISDYFPYIGVLDLQGLSRRAKRLNRFFDIFLERIMDDHAKNKNSKREEEDLIDTMMAIMESGEAGFEFDRRHIKAMLLDLLIGGMDTSATATDWAMSELMRHPAIMKKLQEEIESVVGLDAMVEESQLEKLKYLECVVKETLRLHPVSPLLIPHESTEDCELQGFYVPKKARIMVNVWAIGRDPDVWENPNSFSPERFIGRDIDMSGRYFELLPFGAGRRGCPGLQLGLTRVKYLLAQLVHCFDWHLPHATTPADVDMTEHFGLVTSRAKSLVVRPTYRLRYNSAAA